MKGAFALPFYPIKEAAVVRRCDSNPKTTDPKTSYWGTPKGEDIKRCNIRYDSYRLNFIHP